MDQKNGFHPADPYHDELETKHSQTIGEHGPVVLQDGILHETLNDFVDSKIPERAVHVKGYGAFGYFQPYQSMHNYTTLNFLQKPNKRTPVTVRYSLAVSTKGTPDTGRNVRGMSTKFYTENGVFDLLCNHIPVFLVRDAMRFPESIKSFSPSPVNNLVDPNRFWDFVSRTKEATHFVTWLYSDLGTIKNFRHMRSYGVNTYTWINAEGKKHWVKYHWLPLAGEQTLDRFEATKLAGENPDISGQELYDSIKNGYAIEYELCIQIMEPEDAKELLYDPLDDTKVWNETQFPLHPIGRLVLNQNPTNYMEQVEKLAFSPNNLLDGVELSNDKMLQGRSFIYWDAQRRRLGTDFRSIPINAQLNWSPDNIVSSGLGDHEDGTQMRVEYPKPDDFMQAGEHYMSLSKMQQEHLIDNIASQLYAVPLATQNIVMSYFQQANEDFAQGISQQMIVYSNKQKK